MYVEISGHAEMRLFQRYGIKGDQQIEWCKDIMDNGLWSVWRRNKHGRMTCRISLGTASIIIAKNDLNGKKMYRVVTVQPPHELKPLSHILDLNNTIVGGNINA